MKNKLAIIGGDNFLNPHLIALLSSPLCLCGEPMAFVPVVRGENKLTVKNETTDPAEIILIGAIGKSWYDDSGITEQEIRDALKTIPAGKPINLRINSEGGSVKEGLGIYNAIKERKDSITAHITGYALSIASVFPLAAGKVVSPKSAIWMMHKAWSWNQGNADDMRHAAEMLDAHDETLVDIYAAETGKTKAEIRDAMEKETWIKGADAVAFGLADETDPEEQEQASDALLAAGILCVSATPLYRPLNQEFISRCKNISPEILNAISASTANPDYTVKISAAPANGGQQPPTQPQEPTMNKKTIVALLITHGIKVDGKDLTETSPDADFETALTALAKKPGIDAEARFAAIEAKLELANTARVTDKVLQYVTDGRITNDEAPIYVAAALKDEKSTLAILDKKDITVFGGSPISYTGVSILDNPAEAGRPGLTGLRGPQSEMLVNIRNEHKTPKARHQAILNVFETAFRQAEAKDLRMGKEPMAANTYSGTLVTSFLMDGSMTDLQNVWAFLNAFSIAKDTDPYKPLATGVIKHVTAGEATQTNPTNFEPSDGSTVGAVSVTTAWYNQPMRVGPTDLNNGLRMEDLRTMAISKFADKITQVATVPMTSTLFTATPIIRAAAAFGWPDASTARGRLKKSPIKNLILDGDYLAGLENVPSNFQDTGIGNGARRTFGWDGIYEATNWTTAGNNVRGFACHPQAIVRATGLPLNPPNIPGGAFTTSTFEVPGCGVACAMSMWFSLATRTMFVSFDIIAGFKEVDTTAGVVIASGTPT